MSNKPRKIFRPCPLERKHPRRDFDCGSEPLNVWLRQYSSQAAKKNSARTYVALDGDGRIAGFYTLVFGSVSWDEAPENIRREMPRHAVPVMILARLAVDKNYQGLGVGQSLLQDAVVRTVEASRIAGLKAILVHAKDGDAAAYYSRYSFTPVPGQPLKLMVSLEEIRKALP
jgi:GNAT superfamily N-acetyltransferase